MSYTEITYIYNHKKHSTTVNEWDYTHGDMKYADGIVETIKSLTRAGAIVTRVESRSWKVAL